MKTLAIVLSLCLAAPALVSVAMAGQTVSAPAAQPVSETTSAAPKPQPLTEEESRELAQRAEQPGKEVAGGALTNQQLTYIVIALAAAVIVLIAVK